MSQIRDLIKNKGLSISRIPQKKRQQFIELADAEFANDFGMCLSFLLDYFYLISPTLARLDALEKRLDDHLSANSSPAQETKKPIKMMGGNEIKVE